MCRRRCCGPTGWWPARRPPGPRVWPVTSAGVTPRRAARRWWCSITTRRVRPGRSSRWSRPSRRSLPASRSPTPGPAPSRPGDRRATTAATRRWRCWRGGWGAAGSRGGGRGGWGGGGGPPPGWAGGGAGGPPVTEPPPPDLTVAAELDPPVERVEAAAFVARGLADDLHRRLTARGSACTRLIVGVETEHGERHERVWRTEGTFSALAIADRVRWQLDGWLAAGAHRPSGPGGGGPGGRGALVPAAAAGATEPRPAALPGWVAGPWPGVVPEPAPAA